MAESLNGEQKSDSTKMGFLSCTSYVIGNIIGSGIFITPTSIVAEVNSVGLSLLIWAVCGIVSLLGSIVYIELGTSIPEPGCDFAYVCYVNWNSIAFAFMWVGVLITFPASIAVQAQTFGNYILEGLSPLAKLDAPYDDLAGKALGFSLLAFILWLNFHSLNSFAAKFQVIVTVAKLGSMILIISAGLYLLLFKGRTSNLENAFEGSNYKVGNIVLGIYAGMWSYAGWDVLNYGTPEIKRPERTMPLSLIAGILMVCLIYTLINISYFVVLDVDEVKNATAIAATFSHRVFGNFSYAVPFMVAVLICGTLNSNIFCASRVMYAAARERQLPAFLSCINEANGSPRAALLTQVLMSAAMTFIDTNKLIEYVSFVMFFQRIATMVALLWIRYKGIPVHPAAQRVPTILTWLFLLLNLALVIIPLVTSFLTTAIGFAIVIAGILFYEVVLKRKSIPSWLQTVNGSLASATMIILRCKTDVKATNEYLESTSSEQQPVQSEAPQEEEET